MLIIQTRRLKDVKQWKRVFNIFDLFQTTSADARVRYIRREEMLFICNGHARSREVCKESSSKK